MIPASKKYDVMDLIAIFFGIATFYLFMGMDAVNPMNAEWLMAGMDTPTYFLGWEFFRHSPFWQFPFGANPAYGTEIGSSIVFSDSLPLFAFIFKLLNPVLPSNFQYQGIWLLLCFALQGYFANRLLGLFISDRLARLFGVIFFLIVPIFLVRVIIHHGLAAQWMILAGLYFYFSVHYSFRRWLVLVSVASLIHAYILVMVLAVFGAELLQRFLKKEESIATLGLHLLIAVSTCLFFMYFAGYFLLDGGVQLGDYGIIRTNLLFFIDSESSWSIFLPDIPTTGLDNFSYMGLGILALCVVCLFRVKYLFQNIQLPLASYLPLGLVTLSLFVFSLSSEIAFGGDIVFSFSPPWLLGIAYDTFRGVARFSWPFHYLIFFTAIVCVHKAFSTRIAQAAIGFALLLQITDLSEVLQGLVEAPLGTAKWESPLQSPAWEELAEKYDELVYYLPDNRSIGYSELGYLAATNKMKINTGYFARVDSSKITSARQELIDNAVSDKPLAPVLHVFEKQSLWYLSARKANESDFVGIIDNRYVIAPDVGQCRTCSAHSIEPEPLLGKVLNFDMEGEGPKHFVAGWSASENWGTWTVGPVSTLYFDFNDTPAEDLMLTMLLRAFVSTDVPVQ
jgi:hypothetical protein